MIKPDRIFFQIPFCCSSENRRCAVDFEPYCAGISSHLHPTDRTNRIPLIVILSLHRGRPVLAGFGQMFYYCVPLGISHFFVNHEKCICVVIVRSVLSQIIYKMICFRISCFIEKPIEEISIEQKTDDLSIATQYTQRAHSKQFIFVDVKIFEHEQNKYNKFDQNYGFIPDVEIQVIITNEDQQEIFSSVGVSNDKGLFETKYLIPDNSKRETLTITISAENNNSLSSKIFQVFTLGNIQNSNSPNPPP